MSWLDFILAAIVVTFAWRCFWLGFIKSFGSLIGLVVGAIAASYAYDKLFNLVKFIFGDLENIGRIICFFALFIVFSRLIYIVFAALDKAYDFISIIPFLGPINNLLGAILGAIIGLLVCGLVIYVGSRFFSEAGVFGQWLLGSKLVPFFNLAAKLLAPILSGSLKSLKSII